MCVCACVGVCVCAVWVWGFDTAWAAKCCNDGALVQVATSAGFTTPFHCYMSQFKLINPTKTKKQQLFHSRPRAAPADQRPYKYMPTLLNSKNLRSK